MIKLAEGSNKVFCSLTITEFKYLTKNKPEDVVDGTAISLLWIKNVIDSISNFQSFISDAKGNAETLATKLGAMLT